MELRASQDDMIPMRETSFSRAKSTAIPRIVPEEVKKTARGKMCKVQDTMCDISAQRAEKVSHKAHR